MDQLPPGVPLSAIPAQAPPTGVVPDFDNNYLAPTAIAVFSITIGLEVIFLYFRLQTKWSHKTNLLVDDWCAIVTFFLSLGLGICLMLNKRLAKHTWDMSLAEALDPKITKITFASIMLLGPAVYMGKICMLTLYRRLFGHIPYVNWSLVAAAILGLAVLVMTPLDAVACSPPRGAPWGTPNPNCPKTYKYGIAQGTANLLIDIFIFVLPIPIVYNLNMPKKKRLGVLVIFMFGILAIIADAAVMKFRVDMFNGWDLNLDGYVILLCAVVEAGISVICSSMPATAKFSRLAALEKGPFATLRSLLTRVSRSQRSGSSRQPSNDPSPTNSNKSHRSHKSHKSDRFNQKKKPDPYSINMPTDNSITQLHDGGYIELMEDPQHGRYAHDGRTTEVKTGSEVFGLNGGEIKKTISVEQTSITGSHSGKSITGYDAV